MYNRLFSKLLPAALTAAAICTFSVKPLTAESIFLKDGSIFNGTIVTASDESITIRMDDETIKDIPRKNIIKILYTKIKTSTKNSRPEKVAINKVEKTDFKDRKITWLPSTDPDGVVVKYRIYGTTGDMRRMIDETKTTEYIIKNATSYDRIEISAVDDKETESDSIRADVAVEEFNIQTEFIPSVFFPLGKLGSMSEPGYGFTLTLSDRDIFFSGFETGINTGFYYAQGKNLLNKGKPHYHRFFIIPVLIKSDYRMNVWDKIFIIPAVSFGCILINEKLIRKSASTYNDLQYKGNILDPAIQCGVGIEYNISGSTSISLISDYGILIEKSGSIPFFTAGLGIKQMFQ